MIDYKNIDTSAPRISTWQMIGEGLAFAGALFAVFVLLLVLSTF